MNIEIINNIPGIQAVMDKGENGDIKISIFEQSKQQLGAVGRGEAVKLGKREFIVLGHGKDTTAVITKEFTNTMAFGSDGDWRNSDVRKYCNGEFYNELAGVVGQKNIVQHTVNLVADDGTGKGITCKDNVSILTTDLYRRYRDVLPAYGEWWWTATRVNADDPSYARHVCYVYSSGFLNWRGCGYSNGVRPFCILNSSILVS